MSKILIHPTVSCNFTKVLNLERHTGMQYVFRNGEVLLEPIISVSICQTCFFVYKPADECPRCGALAII